MREKTQYIKPDIITGCESWLSDAYSNAEILPPGYNKQVIRGDRDKWGGGVFIACKDDLKVVEIRTKAKCEIVWGEIMTLNGAVVIGSFYRHLVAT